MSDLMNKLTEVLNDDYSDELGGIVKELESLPPDLVLPIGISNPHSYRGYYDQLAFEPAPNITAGECLKIAKSCIDKRFTGYKGGDFKMGLYTPCWLCEHGRSGGIQLSVFLIRLLVASTEKR